MYCPYCGSDDDVEELSTEYKDYVSWYEIIATYTCEGCKEKFTMLTRDNKTKTGSKP